MTGTPAPQRGDVESVDYADPAPQTRTGPFGRTPEPDERVAIRLHGHPCTYIVRVSTDKQSGPSITELTIAADEGHAVGYEELRAVPARRLAYSARQWIQRWGGQLAFPGDYRETHTQPENADPRLSQLHWRIEQAIMNGQPVRRTVAAGLGISTATVDRLIRKARDEGLLEGVELPRRPSPRQREALIARHERELFLDTHGPYATPTEENQP